MEILSPRAKTAHAYEIDLEDTAGDEELQAESDETSEEESGDVESVPRNSRVGKAAAPATEAVAASSSTTTIFGDTDVYLAADAYSIAFVLALNATPAMYSFWPCCNRSMLPIWAALAVLGAGQLLMLYVITVVTPPVSTRNTFYVDCAAPDSLPAQLLNGDVVSLARADYSRSVSLTEPGLAACLALPVTFAVGGGKEYRSLSHTTTCFDELFTAEEHFVMALQGFCLVLVYVQLYKTDFAAVSSMLAFYDFNRWLLPQLGEKLRPKQWALLIPLVQYAISFCICTASVLVIFGYTAPLSVLFNAVAFTFIGRVAEAFNTFMLAYYKKERIRGLDPAEYGDEPIFYLCPEHDPSQARCDENPSSWYVPSDAQLSGLVSDFQFRHAPQAYTSRARLLVLPCQLLLFTGPPTIAVVVWMHSR